MGFERYGAGRSGSAGSTGSAEGTQRTSQPGCSMVVIGLNEVAFLLAKTRIEDVVGCLRRALGESHHAWKSPVDA
jgi:hypothetical protein